MESIPFMTVDDEDISLSQALQYLRASGAFPKMIRDILRQHVMQKELANHPDVEMDSLQVDQAVLEFRAQRGLLAREPYQDWLKSVNLSHEGFRQQIGQATRIDQLKGKVVTGEQVEDYFNEHHQALDRVTLSRIVVEEEEMANKLLRGLQQGKQPFEAVAKKYSVADEKLMGGRMGIIRRENLPKPVNEVLGQPTKIGEPLGPVMIDRRYCLFQVEEVVLAELNDRLKAELRDRLFEQWLNEKLGEAKIKLDVK